MKRCKKSEASLGMIFQIMIAFVIFSFLGVGFSLGIMSSGSESVSVSDFHRIHNGIFSKLLNDPACFWYAARGPGILYPAQMTRYNMNNCLRKDELSPNYEIEVRFYNPEDLDDANSMTALSNLGNGGGLYGEHAYKKLVSEAQGSGNTGSSIATSPSLGFELSNSALVNVWDDQNGVVRTYLMTLITKAI